MDENNTVPSKSTSIQRRNERVRVVCRIRPLLQREREGISYEEFIEIKEQKFPVDKNIDTNGPKTFLTDNAGALNPHGSAISIAEDHKTIKYHGNLDRDISIKEFPFDVSLSETTDQITTYQHVAKDIVEDVLTGYNGTILAYGQTSTGKSYTMLGKDDQVEGPKRGIIPRAMEDIFQVHETVSIRVYLSYVQLYCEKLFDLLEPDIPTNSILIREDPEMGVYLHGASCIRVTSAADCLALVAKGNTNRVVASTQMNSHSSRSHSVLVLKIEKSSIDNENKGDDLITISHLHLVDLAGSERVKTAKVMGRHVSELKAINLSLSALGNCISALSKHKTTHVQPHIPYRDSKLTRLLQSSLGGNAKTCLLLTVTPSNVDSNETLSTLEFGQRAMRVRVHAQLGIASVRDYKLMYEQLQQKMDSKEEESQLMAIELLRYKEYFEHEKEKTLKAHLHISHLEFKMQANSSPTNNNASKNLSEDNSEKSQYVISEEKIKELMEQHERDLSVAKLRFEEHISSYKKVADEASEEWHQSINQRMNEKEELLKTLQELKEFKKQYIQLESETTERMAELIDDAKENEKIITQLQKKLIEQAQNHQETTQYLTTKLNEAIKEKSKYEEQLQSNYVPRESIVQMESLYESAISKLLSRVEALEKLQKSNINAIGNNSHELNQPSNTAIKDRRIEKINTNSQNVSNVKKMLPTLGQNTTTIKNRTPNRV